MFKINNKETKIEVIDVNFYHITTFLIVSIVEFEQVLVCWLSLSFTDYLAPRQRDCSTDNGKPRTTSILVEWQVLQNIRYLHRSFSWGYEILYGIDTETLPSQVSLKNQFNINVMSKKLSFLLIAYLSNQCSR